MEGRFELDLEPDWGTIKATWDPFKAHLAARGLAEDEAYALSMVAQELLENAVKYGSFGPGRERVRLALSCGDGALTLEVRTPLGADAGGLKRLDGMVQWIRGFQNPFEAWVERLKEISARPYDNTESGLGLVRAAYEGQCILDFFIDEFNVLAMSAVYQPQAGLPGGSHAGAGDAQQ